MRQGQNGKSVGGGGNKMKKESAAQEKGSSYADQSHGAPGRRHQMRSSNRKEELVKVGIGAAGGRSQKDAKGGKYR